MELGSWWRSRPGSAAVSLLLMRQLHFENLRQIHFAICEKYILQVETNTFSEEVGKKLVEQLAAGRRGGISAFCGSQVLPNQTYFRQTIFGLDFNSNAWKCDQTVKMQKRKQSENITKFLNVISTEDRSAK